MTTPEQRDWSKQPLTFEESQAERRRYAEQDRARLPGWEVREWTPQSGPYGDGPGYWSVLGYAHSRSAAASIAEAVHKRDARPVDVWCIDPQQLREGARETLWDSWRDGKSYDAATRPMMPAAVSPEPMRPPLE